MNSPSPTAAALVIGNEILSGRTNDSNINYIAKKLFGIGIKLAEVRVIPDIEDEIISAVNALRSRYTYVFTTGGIGSTHDDITAASVAKAFNALLVENPESIARITAHYTPEKMNPARRRMALMPQCAKLIDNVVSAIPGFQFKNVYVLAGVPDIMKAMLDSVAVGLVHGAQIYTATISCKTPESTIADELAAIAIKYPELDIGSYPTFRIEGIGLSIVVRGTDNKSVQSAANDVCALITSKSGDPIVKTMD